jgi:hypothetical protein
MAAAQDAALSRMEIAERIAFSLENLKDTVDFLF